MSEDFFPHNFFSRDDSEENQNGDLETKREKCGKISYLARFFPDSHNVISINYYR